MSRAASLLPIALLAASHLCHAQPFQLIEELRKGLTFHASFDRGTEADFGLGDRRIYTAPSYKAQQEAKPGFESTDAGIVAADGRFGAALHFKKKNTRAIFYRGEKNVEYSPKGWNGTVSFWLSLDPDQDLEPGFCDPIQVTDKAYNDDAIWVDFTKDDKPRHFRLGVFGDLKAWNPDNLPSDKYPNFARRLIDVSKPPFARGQWTHIAITFSGLNTESGGTAKLYLNGRLQGTTEAIREHFTWDLSRAAIRIGVNYIGLFDDLAIFNRPLSEREVRMLGRLRRGVSDLH